MGLMIAAFVFIGMLGFWLCIYCYVLFLWGRNLGTRYRLRVSSQIAALGIGVGSAIVAVPSWYLFTNPVYSACTVAGVWIIHFQPVSVGFWSECVNAKVKDALRFQSTTDAWLAEWEPDEALPEKVEP